MKNIYLLKWAVYSLCILCLISGLLWKQKNKEKNEVKIEVQAKGKLDRVGNVFSFTEVSTGEVMTVDKGIFLMGDSRFYKVPDISHLNLSRGDSVYVVNGKAYATMPDKAELTEDIQEMENLARKFFGVFCALLCSVIGGTVIWAISQLRRKKL